MNRMELVGASVALLCACGGSEPASGSASQGSGPSASASSGAGGSGGGTDGATAFLGVYDATYAGTVNITSPPMPPSSNQGTGVIAVEKDAAKDLKFTITFSSPDVMGQVCIATMTLGQNGVAVFDPQRQMCSLTSNAGHQQENTNTGDASINGTTLTVHVDGSIKGTLNAQPYSGTFKGTWTGTRQ
jgi:hypothetical protein